MDVDICNAEDDKDMLHSFLARELEACIRHCKPAFDSLFTLTTYGIKPSLIYSLFSYSTKVAFGKLPWYANSCYCYFLIWKLGSRGKNT